MSRKVLITRPKYFNYTHIMWFFIWTVITDVFWICLVDWVYIYNQDGRYTPPEVTSWSNVCRAALLLISANYYILYFAILCILFCLCGITQLVFRSCDGRPVDMPETSLLPCNADVQLVFLKHVRCQWHENVQLRTTSLKIWIDFDIIQTFE